MVAKLKLGRSTFFAIRATFAPALDDLNASHPFDRALAAAKQSFLAAMHLPGAYGGTVRGTFTDAEVALLGEEFQHLGSTPGLIDEFETTRRNDQIRLAFLNLAAGFGVRTELQEAA